MKAIFALLKKDSLNEMRTAETISLIVCMSILLSVVVAFGVDSSFLGPAQIKKLYPALLWMTFVFTATVSISRSFDFELRNSAIESLYFTGVSPAKIFITKVFGNFVQVLIGHLISMITIGLILNVNIWAVFSELLLISVLVIVGYAALATLLAAMTGTSRLSNMLLPLIMLPLLFPLFFGAIELTSVLFENTFFSLKSVWVSLIFGLDVVYIALGVSLYEFVIHD